MAKGALCHSQQIDQDTIMPPKQATAGYAIGIIVIDSWYPFIPGNVTNASTYRFPVIHKILEDISFDQLLSGSIAVTDKIIAAGEELIEKYGVRAIAGACGSFALYQKDVAAALDVPTFLSVMLQVPLILQSLRPNQRIGVVFANRDALTDRVLKQCEITDMSRLAVTEVKELEEFQRLLQNKGRFNSYRMEKEVTAHVDEFVKENPDIGAILLQCSDLPPYAWSVQNKTGLPVFDMNSLIELIYHAVVRKPYDGIV
jgi:hypothetical protein